MLRSGCPSAYAASCSRSSRTARGRKALLAPPTCGVMRTPGLSQRGWSAGRGSGSVTSSGRPQSAGRRLVEEGPGVDDGAARNVDQQRPVGHGCQELAVDQTCRCRQERHDDDHDIVPRQQLGKVLDAVHRRHEVVAIARTARYRGQCHLEGRQPCSDGPAHRAVADDEHPLVSQGRPELQREPPAISLGRNELRQAPQRGEGERHGELGSRGVVDPGGIGQAHPWGQLRQDVVVAGAEQLHHLDPRRLGEGGDPRCGAHVGRHDEADLVRARWGAVHLPGDELETADWTHLGDPVLTGKRDDGHGATVVRWSRRTIPGRSNGGDASTAPASLPNPRTAVQSVHGALGRQHEGSKTWGWASRGDGSGGG